MLSAVWCAAHVAAQSDATPPPAPDSTVSPLTPVVPKPTLAFPTPERAISSTTADKLAAARPKLPPLVQRAAPKPAGELPDLRETDKPQNGIVRLPKFMVREPKPPVFRERDFLDEAGRIALGMKRHPGLGAFPFAGLNAPIALQMLQEEARLEDMAAFNDLIRTASVNDPAARGKLRDLWRQTYLRDNSWVVQRGVSWAEAKR